MGDQVELSTIPHQHGIFFKVSNNALVFEVKASGFVSIGLAKRPSQPCEVWVVIGHDSVTWIGKSDTNCAAVVTDKILSNNEYRSFILVWRNDCIQLFTTEDRLLIIDKNMFTSDLMYATFSVTTSNSSMEPAHWKFEIPPSLRSPAITSLGVGKPQWVSWNNRIPADALIGGFQDEPLYIMRAPHNQSLACGKLVPSKGLGYIAWGHLAHAKKKFEVLCGRNCIWVKSFNDKVPAGAVVAGYSEYMQGTMYVGRAEHNGHLIPGKVQPTHKMCFIAYEGKEVPKDRFEVLVSPEESARCSNDNINYTSETVTVPPYHVNMAEPEHYFY